MSSLRFGCELKEAFGESYGNHMSMGPEGNEDPYGPFNDYFDLESYIPRPSAETFARNSMNPNFTKMYPAREPIRPMKREHFRHETFAQESKSDGVLCSLFESDRLENILLFSLLCIFIANLMELVGLFT